MSSEKIQIDVETIDNVTFITLKGSMDAVTSPLIQKKIVDLIQSGKNKLIVDMSEISFLSSAGLRVILYANMTLKSLNGKIVFCCVIPKIMEIIKIAGFDKGATFKASKEDAIRAILIDKNLSN